MIRITVFLVADRCVPSGGIINKKKRTESTAILEISGRDQQDQRLYLTRNPEKLSWDLEKAENDLWHEPPEPLLEAIAKLVMPEQPEWSGTGRGARHGHEAEHADLEAECKCRSPFNRVRDSI